MRFSASILCISLVVVGAPPARSATTDPIGSAVAVVDLVTAQIARETRTLTAGDDVRQNEIIEVGLNASSELRLNDNTKLALGPGSRLVLDKFVYDPGQSGGSIFVNLAKGTFRFMTGLAEKPAYVIRVPTASITVRGTIFDVFVEESGRSWLLLHEGGVRICNDRGSCRDHSEVGKIIPVSEQGDLGRPSRWASLSGLQKVAFDDAFPFVASAPSIDPNPVLTRDEIVGDEASKPYTPREASGTSDDPRPRKRVDTPRIEKATAKLAKIYKSVVTERDRKASADHRQLAMNAVATYMPALIDRIRERRIYRSSDDNTANSISTGGMLGHGHKKSSIPN